MSSWIRESHVRVGDMHPRRALRVRLMDDGDIIVTIEEGSIPIGGANGATIEFCSLASGGGRSPKTRNALLRLMKAINEDNKEHPDASPNKS